MSKEGLRTWLTQHLHGYRLVSSEGKIMMAEEVMQATEWFAELDLKTDAHQVSMFTENSQAYERIFAIAEPNLRIQVESQPLTFETYTERSPEKLELSAGHLGSDMKDAYILLDLCLETFGLTEVVRRAPKELWERALQQTYGTNS